MRRSARSKAAPLLAVLALLLAGCGDGGEPADEPGGAPEQTTNANGDGGGDPEGPQPRRLDFDRAQTIARGLEVPWGIAFAGQETVLVTERPGRVRLVEDGELRDEPVAEVAVVAEGEGGLMGIALHPKFPDRRFAYLSYTAPGENRVSRFALDDEFGFGDERVIATVPSSAFHNGGALEFGPDGLLYAGTGEAGNPPLAADPQSPAGKILRFEPDGSPAGAEGLGRGIFSYGHRNVQGLGWDADGRLYASEHGPSGELGLCCHDEVNLIREGGFYGWPYRAGDTQAQAGEPPGEPQSPVTESGGDEAWAPAGVAVHQPDDDSPALLVGNLAGERLMRVELAPGSPRRVENIETAIRGLGRVRPVAFGPDGCLFVGTSNRDGRGDPREGDDRLLRVCPRG